MIIFRFCVLLFIYFSLRRFLFCFACRVYRSLRFLPHFQCRHVVLPRPPYTFTFVFSVFHSSRCLSIEFAVSLSSHCACVCLCVFFYFCTSFYFVFLILNISLALEYHKSRALRLRFT